MEEIERSRGTTRAKGGTLASALYSEIGNRLTATQKTDFCYARHFKKELWEDMGKGERLGVLIVNICRVDEGGDSNRRIVGGRGPQGAH